MALATFLSAMAALPPISPLDLWERELKERELSPSKRKLEQERRELIQRKEQTQREEHQKEAQERKGEGAKQPQVTIKTNILAAGSEVLELLCSPLISDCFCNR